MIDELTERLLDWAVDFWQRWSAPWSIRLRRSGLGFRPTLITSGAEKLSRKLARGMKEERRPLDQVRGKDESAYKIIEWEEPENDASGEAGDNRSAQKLGTALFGTDADDDLLAAAAQSGLEPGRPPDVKHAVARGMERLDEAFAGRQFPFTLLMTLLCTCLLADKGTGELGALAAFFCLHWLAASMDEGYAPVCGEVRQTYLASHLLRAAAFAAVLLRYFADYARDGIRSNVVLQGAMLMCALVHLICTLVFVAFNRRQKPFARVLALLLGLLPALFCASGVTLGVSQLAGELPVMIGGILRMVGVILAYLAWEAEMITGLGRNQLVYGRFFHCIFNFSGFFLMLAGAWLTAL